MKKLVLLMSMAAFLFSCKKDDDKQLVFKGPEAKVFNGKAWSTLVLDRSGKPEQLSLTLTDALLNSVPASEDPNGPGFSEIVFHKKVTEVTPFKFIMMDWNPNGHPPAGIYDKPHFDFHFYMTPLSDVLTYTDEAKLMADPAHDYLPANYIGVDPVPQMGKHWVDVNSPELHGQPFTQTFIYGSYDSKIKFMEPMITLAFLKNTSNFERSIPQPAKFLTSGYYPTKLRVIKHNGVTEIILDEFEYRVGS